LKQLAETLNVTQAAVSYRLKAVGKIQKKEKWMPYQLKERDIERRKTICEILLQRHKKSNFCIELLLAMKSGFISTISSSKNHG